MPLVSGVVVLGTPWLKSRTQGVVIAELLARLYPRYAPLPPAGPPQSPTAVTAAEEQAIDLSWANGAGLPSVTELWVSPYDQNNWVLLATVPLTQTTYKHFTGLFDTNHWYRFRHTNATADSTFTTPVQAYSQRDLPGGAPLNLSAVTRAARPAGESTIDLTWTNQDASAATELWRKQGAGAYGLVTTLGAGVATFTDTGLAANTSYTYYVRHTKSGVASDPSATASATTLVDGPDAPPTSLIATGGSGVAGQGTIGLRWTNGDPSAATDIYISTDNGSTWTYTQSAAAGATTATVSVGAFNVRRDFLVQHKKNGVWSASSNAVNAISGQDIPDASPTNLAATVPTSRPAGETTVNLSWTNGDSSCETGIYVNIGSGDTFVTRVPAGQTSYQHTGRTPNATYGYMARHYKNGVESPDSTRASTTTLVDGPDAAPTNLQGTNNGGGVVNLTWTNGDASANTEVYRNGSLVTTVGPVAAAYTDTPGGGQAVAYLVRHVKNAVASGYANQVSFTTLSGAATTPTLTSLTPGFNQVTVNWTNGDSAAQTEVWRSLNDGAYAQVTTVAAGATSYTLGSLSDDTKVAFQLRHIKNGFTSGWSNILTGYSYDPPNGAPSGLSVSPLSFESASGLWNNGDGSVQTEVFLRVAGGSFARVALLGAGSTLVNFTSLVPETAYEWYAQHTNTDRTGTTHTRASGTSAFTTQALPAPTNASVSYQGADNNTNGGDYTATFTTPVAGGDVEWAFGNSSGTTVASAVFTGANAAGSFTGYMDANLSPSFFFNFFLRTRKTYAGVQHVSAWSQVVAGGVVPTDMANVGGTSWAANISFTGATDGSQVTLAWTEANSPATDNNAYDAEVYRPDGSLVTAWYSPRTPTDWSRTVATGGVTGLWSARVRARANGYLTAWTTVSLSVSPPGAPQLQATYNGGLTDRIWWQAGPSGAYTQVEMSLNGASFLPLNPSQAKPYFYNPGVTEEPSHNLPAPPNARQYRARFQLANGTYSTYSNLVSLADTTTSGPVGPSNPPYGANATDASFWIEGQDPSYLANVSWSYGDSSAQTRVYVNSSLAATFGAGGQSGQVSMPGTGTFTVTCKHYKDSVESSGTSTTVTIRTPTMTPAGPQICTDPVSGLQYEC